MKIDPRTLFLKCVVVSIIGLNGCSPTCRTINVDSVPVDTVTSYGEKYVWPIFSGPEVSTDSNGTGVTAKRLNKDIGIETFRIETYGRLRYAFPYTDGNMINYSKHPLGDAYSKHMEFDELICSQLGGWFGMYYVVLDSLESKRICNKSEGSIGFLFIAFQESPEKFMVIRSQGCINEPVNIAIYREEFKEFLAAIQWLSAYDPRDPLAEP